MYRMVHVGSYGHWPVNVSEGIFRPVLMNKDILVDVDPVATE